MSKLYFCDAIDESGCYKLKDLIDMAKHEFLEIEVIEAKRITGDGYFYCTYYGECGISGDGECGKICEQYRPRNGKNGRCRHSGYCYEHADKKITIKILKD